MNEKQLIITLNYDHTDKTFVNVNIGDLTYIELSYILDVARMILITSLKNDSEFTVTKK